MERTDIVVGIPSRHEATTIGHVVSRVDAGLQRLGTASRSLIVNADNHSADGTRETFEATETAAEKLYLSTPAGVRGKGHNVAGLLRLAAQRQAQAVVIVDADLRSIDETWMPRLLQPILDGAADFVGPRYVTTQGGPLRSLICRPLVAGIFAADVAQPTGGEFALSQALVRQLANVPLPPAAESYGIDIFLTTEAVVRTGRLATADLGRKIHRPRPWDSITPIAREVTRTLFAQIARHRGALAQRDPLRPPPTPPVPHRERPTTRPVSTEEVAGLLTHFRSGLARFADFYRSVLGPDLTDRLAGTTAEGIPRDLWRPVLYGLTRHAVHVESAQERTAAALMPLFEGRMAAFAAEIDAGAEALSRSDMDSYIRDRQYVLSGPGSSRFNGRGVSAVSGRQL